MPLNTNDDDDGGNDDDGGDDDDDHRNIKRDVKSSHNTCQSPW